MTLRQRLVNDAKLVAGQIGDAANNGAVLVCAAIICGALAITFGLILVALAAR